MYTRASVPLQSKLQETHMWQRSVIKSCRSRLAIGMLRSCSRYGSTTLPAAKYGIRSQDGCGPGANVLKL